MWIPGRGPGAGVSRFGGGEDAAAARSVLAEAGIEVKSEREVLVVDIENQPGELGSIARRLADGGVKIELLYLAANLRPVVGVDDIAKADAIFQGTTIT